jgi:hypothetical protein
MKISRKDFVSLAAEFGLDVKAVREMAGEHKLESVEELRAFLTADTGGGESPNEGGVEEGEKAPQNEGLTEAHVVGLCKGLGIAPKGWFRFLSGSGENDLKCLLPGKEFAAEKVLGVWKAGGKGMNVRKLVGKLAVAN